MLKITIITVCYNEKNKLRKTIESVLDQTYPAIEYIIIDGASMDGTLELLQEYAGNKKMVFYSEKDNGIYDAMNRGILKSTGEYIFFINSGDLLYDDCVIEKVAYSIENSCKEIRDKSIFYGRTCLIYADGLVQVEDYSKWEGSLKEKIFNGTMPCHQSIIAPKKSLANHLFKDEYKIRADYEWLVYSICNGYDCVSIPVTISCFDTTGMSGRLKNSNVFKHEEESILKSYQEYFTDKERSFRERKLNDKENMAVKYHFLFQLMSNWLALRQKKLNIGQFLTEKGYQSIAIYGMSHMGLRLLDELKEAGLAVKYVVDKNIDNIRVDVKKVLINEDLESVDAVIVTAVSCFYEIKERLEEKLVCPIISLEDLIFEVACRNKN